MIPQNISLLLFPQFIFLFVCSVLVVITFSQMKQKEVNQSKNIHNFVLLWIVFKIIYGALKILVVVVYYSNKEPHRYIGKSVYVLHNHVVNLCLNISIYQFYELFWCVCCGTIWKLIFVYSFFLEVTPTYCCW